MRLLHFLSLSLCSITLSSVRLYIIVPVEMMCEGNDKIAGAVLVVYTLRNKK